MNERADPQTGNHPQAQLLPWYAAGTLSQEERAQIQEHLRGCASCQTELQEMTRLRASVKAAYEKLPGPPTDVFRKVLTRIEAESARRPGVSSLAALWWRWIAPVEAGLRMAFTVRWVPALATVLLVSQGVALLWIAGQPSPSSERDGVIERSVPSSSFRLRVVFQEAATEPAIRAALRNVNGRIVDGPFSDGAYIVEVPVGDPSGQDAVLQALRTEPSLIKGAERAQP